MNQPYEMDIKYSSYGNETNYQISCNDIKQEESSNDSTALQSFDPDRQLHKKFTTGPSFEREGCSDSDSYDEFDQVSDASDLQLTGINKIIFSEEFFKIIEKREKSAYEKKMGGIIAVCQTCSKKIKGSLGVSSNFLSHLRKQHPILYTNFMIKKQADSKKSELGTSRSFSRKILNFICETASPLSVIESESFKKLFPGKTIPSTASIMRLLMDAHEEQVMKLRNILDKVEYVCTTADVWTSGRQSFLGYTSHWLDSNTFQRKSAALACRRYNGCQSFDRITEMICDINNYYKLPLSKIVYTITDNGSNFVEAFKEFGLSMRSVDEPGDDSVDGGEDELETMRMPAFAFEEVSPRLTKHFRCASQSLNSLATTDFTTILNSSSQDTKNLHQLSFSRASNIWNKCGTRKFTETINEVFYSQLSRPKVTKWKSLYDSIKKLLQHKHQLDELCYKLEVATFQPNEITYLEEYLKIMQPIAEAIDFLQGEKNSLFGYFIPALVTIIVKMRRLGAENLIFLKDINLHIQSALIKRFEKYFLMQPDSMDAIIAAVVIPEVKLRFLKPLLEIANNGSEELIKQTLNQYGLEFVKDHGEHSIELTTSQQSFLDFGDDSKYQNLRDHPELACVSREVMAYLANTETDISSLHRYPIIRCLFLKYNTPLPSSAPVERLFSFAGIVNRSKTQKLNDMHFEMIVLKKANKL